MNSNKNSIIIIICQNSKITIMFINLVYYIHGTEKDPGKDPLTMNENHYLNKAPAIINFQYTYVLMVKWKMVLIYTK